MSAWRSVLKGDPTDWLLEEGNPSVRYYTLRDVLGRPERDAEVRASKAEIMTVGTVPRILSRQDPGGYWGDPRRFYLSAKYKGTGWTFVILAALGASTEDKRVRKTCEFMLENSQHRESGGFAIRGTPNTGGAPNSIEPCHTGNMVWSLIRCGLQADVRIRNGIDWIVRHQRFDDGIQDAPTGWPYDGWEMCWGEHTCHMGVVKTVKALAEIPPNKRSRMVKAKIVEAKEFLLKHHIHKRSHDLTRVSNREFTKFGFPCLWDTDALEILDILTQLGCRDDRMQEAIDLVISKQDSEGKWPLERTWNGRTQCAIDRKAKPSKWVTLHAVRVLKRFYS